MNAIILAGGRERADHLRPLAYPAHLVPVANRSLVEHQLAWLAREGVKTAIVALDHRGASLASPPPAGLEVRICYSPGPVGMAAVAALAHAAAPEDDRVLVIDGSLLAVVDLDPLFAAHERSGVAVTTAVPAGSGRRPLLRRLRGAAPVGGVSVVQYDALFLPDDTRPVQVEGYWRELRSPADYLAAHLDALVGELGALPGQEIRPGVYAEGSAHLLSSATLTGPILLGTGSVVGERAAVSDSVIGSSCIIAAGARVERSVVLDGARIGRDAVVSDSIVGPCASVAEGARVSGLSMVGPGARIASGQQLVHASVA